MGALAARASPSSSFSIMDEKLTTSAVRIAARRRVVNFGRPAGAAHRLVVGQTMPRTLRLNAPPVWLEAEGASRSAATIGSITAAATASSSESSISTRTQDSGSPKFPR